jgi:uncharacterized protein YkwD
MRATVLVIAAIVPLLGGRAFALDLNSFRAAHGLPKLSYSGALASAAYEHAHDMARREHLDHNGFRVRIANLVSGIGAENVLWGCKSEDCAIRNWAKSPGHRRNMLLRGISKYGIASARAANGQRYWVLELGN